MKFFNWNKKPTSKKKDLEFNKVVLLKTEILDLKTKKYFFKYNTINNWVIKESKDLFSNEIKIFFDCAVYADGFIPTYENNDFFQLNFSIKFLENEHKLVFSCLQKNFKFTKGEQIEFILENKDKLSFIIQVDGYRLRKETEGVVIETFTLLNSDLIKKLSENKILYWQYTDIQNHKYNCKLNATDESVKINILFKVYNYYCENILNK